MDSPHSPDSPDFARLLGDITRELREREIPFMLIGGQAVLLHGRPIARRQADTLDWGYVEHWAEQFAALSGHEDMPARVEKLRAAAKPERHEP